MKTVEILVIGGGPAGLCAALSASALGAKVLIAERDEMPGGQLVKQTHKFFGSEKQHAGERGIHIGQMLLENAQAEPNIELWTSSCVLSIYEDGVVTIEHAGQHVKVKPERIIIATGAAEKFLGFPGNDLPGIYGAGAVQTLMNVDGVKPAQRVLMVGAGNIGLIVSYQLKQAGVEVEAVIEGSSKIGGYLVHASKIQRAGIPVLIKHTILEAYGDGQVEGAVIAQIDECWQPIAGTERKIACDTICLAVGLSPLTELAWQAGCEVAFIRELSGHVPIVNECLESTVPGIYCAGDVSGIEEASAAMVEGRLAGLCAAVSLSYGGAAAQTLIDDAKQELDELRAGSMGIHIREGLEKMALKSGQPKSEDDTLKSKSFAEIKSTLISDGIATADDIAAILPTPERFAKGPIAIAECFQEIPCNPCVKACKAGAITMPGDINDVPVVNGALCNGCGLCISLCPGLAIVVVDQTYSEDMAIVRLPYEYVPLPVVGTLATGLDREGNALGQFEVKKVTSGGKKNMTYTISLVVPKALAMDVRGVSVV
ncbi:MAG: FAD-dependent oxidoreductase [Oscillospiraceae bacterium]|nr:FAD-dependent oxidoreductase [Oscillospiraceae bacterium]